MEKYNFHSVGRRMKRMIQTNRPSLPCIRKREDEKDEGDEEEEQEREKSHLQTRHFSIANMQFWGPRTQDTQMNPKECEGGMGRILYIPCGREQPKEQQSPREARRENKKKVRFRVQANAMNNTTPRETRIEY